MSADTFVSHGVRFPSHLSNGCSVAKARGGRGTNTRPYRPSAPTRIPGRSRLGEMDAGMTSPRGKAGTSSTWCGVRGIVRHSKQPSTSSARQAASQASEVVRSHSGHQRACAVLPVPVAAIERFEGACDNELTRRRYGILAGTWPYCQADGQSAFPDLQVRVPGFQEECCPVVLRRRRLRGTRGSLCLPAARYFDCPSC